jgi:hypothetical protein
MPVLVLARVTKGKIPVWALSEYVHNSIGNRSVPVLALHDSYQYWQTYKNARTGTNGGESHRVLSTSSVELMHTSHIILRLNIVHWS